MKTIVEVIYSMNRNRKVQVAALTLSAGMMFAGAGFSVPAQASPLAGVMATVSVASAVDDTDDDTEAAVTTGSTLSGVNRVLADIVTDTADVLDEEEQQAEDAAAAEAARYEKLAVASVNDYANVRAKASADSKLVGHIYNNNLGHVLDTKGDWVKIKSGDVTGWVKKDYLTVGSEKAVKAAATKIATVKTTTLKVRAKADSDSEVLNLVPGTSKLKVVGTSSVKDGWVKVKADDDIGYVSTDYVDIKDTYSHAKTIEAIKAAQAAAAKEVQAEAAAAAATGTTSNTSTNSGSTSTSTASTSSSSSTYSGGSGSSVASYACQFVGNPYVWGGTSLTNGADCSGFVMSVYRHFGVSLPHSSASDRSVGTGVSTSEMRAGDIVCYSGHVAIYIGNGQIVHASNHRDGIKISNANYRSILAVRRVM